MSRQAWLWTVVVILLAAALLRLAAFGQVPPGLYHDEAYHGLDAAQVLQGRLSLYFEANNGREPLFIYLVALAVGVLGKSPFALRLPSFFAGLLTVGATAAMGRALFSRRAGALSGAVLAVTLWHVHLSRVGFRAVLLPMFTALAAWQAALALRRTAGRGLQGARLHWVAAGVLYGLAFYTYTAARFTPVALAALGLYALATQRRAWKSPLWRGVGLMGLVALVMVIPLAVAAVRDPEVVLGRPGQVSFLNPAISGGDPWGTLGGSIVRTLGMFFIRGDRIWRHNVPWRAVFDPLLGAAFVLGLPVALRGARRDFAAGFILIWTAVMSMPTILAEDAPHFLRAVGVLPTAAVLPALGLDWLMCRSLTTGRGLRIAGRAIVALILLCGLFSTARATFGSYARDPVAGYWFEHGATMLAGRVNAFLNAGWDGERMRHGDPIDRQVILDRRLWEEWPQVRFLVAAPDAVHVGLEEQPAEAHVAVFVWPYGDWRQAWALLPAPAELAFEEGPLSRGDLDVEAYTTYLAFYATPLDATYTAAARFSGGVELLGVEATPGDDGQLRVRLRWRATAPLAEDYTVFLHYLREGERIAQADSRPAAGLYPTTAWRSGDVIHDDHDLVGVGVPDPARDTLLFGFWQPESGEVLYLLDEVGNPAGDWIELAVGPSIIRAGEEP